ncbi:hypothetical protein D9619_004756 [Psilocybe cf. subviscida]|uniref:mannan endo-1,4-beta-mannosidase n=1 Tax=Psilocybe cf. subviscida TaxID=2480587 RepID=A0A8H5BR16_9AGAR|nr:hypothetical protein D9619_004756 [Psilocybe cf. subviscida]
MHLGGLALLLPILSVSATGTGRGVSREPASRFVSIDKKSLDFVANGSKIDFIGTNAYWLPTLNSEADIDSVLAKISAAGVKVVRTWAFNDVDAVPETGTWFQLITNGTTSINTGVNGLQKLDTVVRLAERHGIFVVLSLTNNWNPRALFDNTLDVVSSQGRNTSPGTSSATRPRNALSNDYGGMDAYVREFGESSNHDEFYTNPTIMSHFLNYTSVIVSRYRNNTSIFSWEVANDPRCGSSLPASPSCNTTTVTTFHVTVSQHIKTVDPNHLISSGNQGFICDNCPKIIPLPPRASLLTPLSQNPSPARPSALPSSSPSALPARARSLNKAKRLMKQLTAERKSISIKARRYKAKATDFLGSMRIRGRWAAPPTLHQRQSAEPPQGLGSAFDGCQGVDSQDILNIPDISYSTFQLFSDQNSYGMDDPTLPAFNNTINQGLAWIRQHAAIGMMANKPVTLTGFGLVSQSNAQFFVPFNRTEPPFASISGNSTAGLNAASFITDEQRDEAYALWLSAGLEAGLQGMFQYQWTQGNLTAVLGASISPNTNATGNVTGTGFSPNDGYGQVVGDLGVQSVIACMILAVLLVKVGLTHLSIYLYPQLLHGQKERHPDMDDLVYTLSHQEHDYELDPVNEQDVERCISGIDFKLEPSTGKFRSGSTRLQVPIVKDLSFISRGQTHGGLVRLVSSPDQLSKSITVEVISKYVHDDIRNLAKICQASKGRDAREISLSYDQNCLHGADNAMYFETTITLPENSEESQWHVRKLVVDSPNSTYRIGNLSFSFFEEISLLGQNSSIQAQFLKASNIYINTTNSPIERQFNVTEALIMKTSNSSIRAGLQTDSSERVN